MSPKHLLPSEPYTPTENVETASRRMCKTRKHVPHALRSTDFVTKRNLRERRRVDAVNKAFGDLRDILPLVQGDGKVSKMSILQQASLYIQYLSLTLNSGPDGLMDCSRVQHQASDVMHSTQDQCCSPSVTLNSNIENTQCTRSDMLCSSRSASWSGWSQSWLMEDVLQCLQTEHPDSSGSVTRDITNNNDGYQ